MIHFKKIDHPRVFFKHDLDNLRKNDIRNKNSNFFAIVDESGKMIRKQLYTLYHSVYESDNLIVVNKCVEEKYSDTVIQLTRQWIKKQGMRPESHYEYHYENIPVVIDKNTGKEVVCGKYGDYVYIYDNLILFSHNSNATLYDMNGKILVTGDYKDFKTNDNYVCYAYSGYGKYNYPFMIFNRKEGKLIATYV